MTIREVLKHGPLAGLLWVLASPGLASADEVMDLARKRYESGERDYVNGRFWQAAKAFEEAFDLSKRPDLLFNAARAYDRGEYAVRAIETYEAYLKSTAASDQAQIELRLGELRKSLATLAQVASHPRITQLLPALSAAASGAATPQVRQLATVGGNLMQRPRCWYFRSAEYQCLKKGGGECFAREGENDFHSIFDNRVCSAVHPSALATALWALDAVVLITGPQGERSARLSALLVSASQPGGDVRRENKLAPEEIITALYVPMPKANERNVYLKLKQKQSFDWPLVEVAVAVRMSQKPGALFEAARVVLGSVAPTPWRAKAAEAALLKLQSGEAAALQTVGQAAVEGATPMQKNGYKVAIAQALVQRAVAELLANRGQ